MKLDALRARWLDGELAPWAEALPAQIAAGLSEQRHGDLPRWRKAVAGLPELAVGEKHLDGSKVGVSAAAPLTAGQRRQLHTALEGLHPWRKGPFELFGLTIDTEWRSDWKWDRLADAIEPLDGRRVLDVGCGNGYHCWRMRGAGATEVIGVDPGPLFVLQFQALQRYLQDEAVWVLPLTLEDVPRPLPVFDTVFSMGVLYHRRSPLDHLLQLRDCLRPGGELVLETLVIEGDEGAALVPRGRYARMGNVWFLPSAPSLLTWLEKMRFRDAALVDVSVTTTKEQRSTPWMRFQSLADFLDPADPALTREGYPAPRRAIVTARAP